MSRARQNEPNAATTPSPPFDARRAALGDALVDYALERLLSSVRPGWLPCKAFGLSPKKAKRLGLTISRVGKTPYVSVVEFDALAAKLAESPTVQPANDAVGVSDVAASVVNAFTKPKRASVGRR